MDWGRVVGGLYLVVLGIVEFLIQTSHEAGHDLFARFYLGFFGLLGAAALTAAIAFICWLFLYVMGFIKNEN